MQISLNWLKQFVDIKMDPKDLGDLLTLKTAEVEKVENEADSFENIVAGLVITLKKHPNADKLNIAMTSVGKETIQIVCGGANLKEGMYVAVAKPGASVKWHGEGEPIVLEKAKIRGEESIGMICAGCEIGIDDPTAGDHDIMDLSSTKPKPGTPLSEIFQRNDVILEFDNKSLTHRPDLWGHYGIAREIAAITGAKLKPYKTNVKIPTSGKQIKVTVKNSELCQRYCGLIIENVKIEQSPDWLKKLLKAADHGTHNNIVDVTNYISSELGQPMHAFDKKIVDKGIIVRTATKGEKITTLDGKIAKLDETMLVIANQSEPLAIAGVIGGKNSGITDGTKTIVLESATFSSSSIRRTSTKLGIRTDSVQRFEKALDPNMALVAIKKAAELILQICPTAKISGPITDIKSFKNTPLKIALDIKKTGSKIGVELSAKEIKDILESLEFKVLKKNPNTFTVTVPTFRATKDVTQEDDVIEEVARMYGYENITASLPKLPTKLPEENIERFKKHRARELFSLGLGFNEVYNYSFYGIKDIKNCLMSEKGHIKLQNYLSEDQTHIRTTLTPNILKNLQTNSKNYDTIKIYEIGRTYLEIGAFHPLETKRISGAIMQKNPKIDPFFEAKGAVESFLKHFSLEHVNYAKGITNVPYAHPQKAISYIDQNGQTIAVVFGLHPSVQKNLGLEGHKIANFSINLTEALRINQPVKKFQAIPRFPAITMDISVLVDANIEIQTIKDSIVSADKNLITQTDLFDIYQGEGISPDKKAVAFKIILQADDRTLTDEEMTTVQNKIFKNLEAIGGKIRGK